MKSEGIFLMKTREDAWTEEEDSLLVNTVLQFIRDGKTQLNAFEQVGEKLNRTSAACGYRWNAELRKQYKEEIEMAKKERNEKKRHSRPHSLQRSIPVQNLSIDDCISFLQSFQETNKDIKLLQNENEHLKNQYQELKNKNKELIKRLETLSKNQKRIEEEYKMIVQILSKASKIKETEEHNLLH